MTEPERRDSGSPGPAPSRPAPERSKGEAEDPRAAARARIEQALNRARPRPVPSDPGPGGATRSGAPATPPAHHWSQAIRQRVSDPAPGSASASTPPEPSGSAVPETPPAEADGESGESARDRIRQRIEARLTEADARRREPPPEEPKPAAEERRASPEEGDGSGTSEAGETADEPPDEGWSLPDNPPAGRPLRRRRRSRLAELVATCLLVGRSPVAPGTIGALLGLFAFAVTRGLSAPVQIGLFVAVALFGGWAAHRHAHDLNAHDPRSVVVDEFVGMWLALIALDPSWIGVVGAFLAFRALDILKPPPVSWAERLPNGFGIMGDDLVAGGLVRLAFYFIG